MMINMLISIQYTCRILVLSLISLCTCFTYAQDNSASLPFDREVAKGILPNGLTYYVKHNNVPAHKIELRLVVKAGSILEDDDQLGLAHFMEHMNFNGTTHFPKNELVSYLQSIGVKFGADLNANTGFDRTVYILSIPAGEKGNIEKGFQVIEDWAHNSLLTDRDIDEERGVVLEESRLHKGTAGRESEAFISKLLDGSRYALRSPIGKDSILHSFPHDALRRYYHDWYRPDLMAVVVVGDIDTAVAKELINDHFAKIANPEPERPHFYSGLRPATSASAVIIKDKETGSSAVSIFWPFNKANEVTTVGYLKESLEKEMVLEMLNQRMTDFFKPSAGVSTRYAGFYNMAHGYTAFRASIQFSAGHIDKALNNFTMELARARDYGFFGSELDLVKKSFYSELEVLGNENNKQNNSLYVDKCVNNFLYNNPVTNAAKDQPLYRQVVAAITLDDVNQLLKKSMTGTDLFVAVFSPDKAGIALPDEAAVLKMVQDELNQKVSHMKEKEIDTVLMSDKPEPGMVVNVKSEPGLGAFTYTLSNGILVTIKPTDFRNDEIELQGIKRGGTGKYDLSEKPDYDHMIDLINSQAVGDFAPNELKKALAGKNIKVNLSITSVTDKIGCSSTKKDLETMLQLMYLKLTSVHKDEDILIKYQRQIKRKLENIYADPNLTFLDSLQRILYAHDPLAPVIPDMNEIDKISLRKVMRIYRHEFSNADGYHFFITGNIDTSVVRPLIETYIGGLKPSGDSVEYGDNGLRRIKGINKFIMRKGKEDRANIEVLYYGDAPYSEELSLRAAALAEVLNIKVTEILREQMSSIYSGGFSASVLEEPYPHYTITLKLPCGPENVDRILDIVKTLIRNIKNSGPTFADLNKVKTNWKEKHEINLHSNTFWTSRLENILFWHRDPDYFLNYNEKVSELSVENIQATAQLLFNHENEFTAVLLPR